MRSIDIPQNYTFKKALAILTHPLCIAALGLLLVNDQVLRRLSPSWWTGKLSDIAWLFIMPFFAAAFLAWLVPGKNHPVRHETWTFCLAFGLTGLAFVITKTNPAVNGLATRIFTTLTHASPSLLLDPSDLLALPALALGAWMWYSMRGAGEQELAFSLPGLRSLERGLVLLPVAALVLMADAAAPDTGITCFFQQGNQIYARGGYDSSFVSQDGGVTWSPYQPGEPIECERKTAIGEEWREATGANPGTLYRYKPDEEIQVSTDSGKTWITGIKFTKISEPERIYYLKSRQGSPSINPGPFDAIPDPTTGNMLFAMGQQGVLVHTTQGQWVWSKGGAYQRVENFPTADALALLIGGMALLAVGTALLIYATLALRWTKHWLRITVLVLAWLGWLGMVAVFPPAISYSYSNAITAVGILCLAVLIIPLAIEQTLRLVKRAPRALPGLLGIALAGAVLFLLPYVFWVYSALPEFIWATIFSLVLVIAILAAGWLLQRVHQSKSAGEA